MMDGHRNTEHIDAIWQSSKGWKITSLGQTRSKRVGKLHEIRIHNPQLRKPTSNSYPETLTQYSHIYVCVCVNMRDTYVSMDTNREKGEIC